ncbi:site-specific integrase [Rhodovulum sulfidophilum]|uniref:site-specific integrase n=1 Tax=Rhodovulum sulfidophilum TaxID=35806 RepID=UPI0038735E65
MWTDDEGKRRRYRLEANTAREAEREARDLILRLDAPPAGMTVAQVWGAYRAEMGDRRQGEKMDFAAKVILPAFGHLSVDRLLAAALDPHIKLAMLLMLTTAGRSGAILELTWDRVDFASRTIRLAANDLGPRKGRATVPINDTLMAALQDAQRAAVSDFVVEWGGRPVRSIKTGFNAAVARAGIDHCTPHDLRRTAGRFMAEAGVPIEEIAEYLGHTNPNITRSTYARFSPEHLRRAAGSLEFGAPKLVQRTRVQTPKGRVSL